jgi:hypothetical protein
MSDDLDDFFSEIAQVETVPDPPVASVVAASAFVPKVMSSGPSKVSPDDSHDVNHPVYTYDVEVI